MTLNSKVISLVLLSSITMGSMFAKVQYAANATSLKKPQAALIRATNNVVTQPVSKLAANATAAAACPTCSAAVNPGSCTGCTSCPPCTVNCLTDCTTCPNPCNTGICQCTEFCATDCSTLTPCKLQVQEALCFKSYMYAENVIGTGNVPTIPSINPNNTAQITCGTFEICFSPNAQAFCYRIVLCGPNIGTGRELRSWIATPDIIAPTTLAPFFNRITLNSNCIVNNGTSLIQTGCITQLQYVFNGATGNTPAAASASNFIPTYWSTSANLCCVTTTVGSAATTAPQTIQVGVFADNSATAANLVRGTQLVAAAAAA